VKSIAPSRTRRKRRRRRRRVATKDQFIIQKEHVGILDPPFIKYASTRVAA